MTKSLEQLEQELANHLERAEALELAIKEAEQLIATLRDEHRSIMGGDYRPCLVEQTRRDIQQVKQAIRFDKMARPVLRGHEDLEEDYRVSRVTPKCLFIMREGNDREDKGILSDPSSYWVKHMGLDIEETIARFKAKEKEAS